MLVVGFDPGSIAFGLAVLEKKNNRISYVHSEVIRLKEENFNAKMKTLWLRLDELYQRFPIASAAIEEGYLGKNVSSMNVLSKVRGVVLASAIVANIELTSYPPARVKQALTGGGNAQKAQVAKVVQMLLNIKDKKLASDESDALAVAYCHALSVS